MKRSQTQASTCITPSSKTSLQELENHFNRNKKNNNLFSLRSNTEISAGIDSPNDFNRAGLSRERGNNPRSMLKKINSFGDPNLFSENKKLGSKSGSRTGRAASKKKLLLNLTKKKLKVKFSAKSHQGFNPIVEKPNQDRFLIEEFEVGGEEIKCFAVADGHGNKNY